MKKRYDKPGINVKKFNEEEILTVSTYLSADSKAIKALNESGTTQNITVKWGY